MSSTPNPGLSGIASIIKQKNPPDVLETIAHISNDEVHTPPKLANQVLDLLPAHVWSNPNLKFLDPAVKSGVFLREAAKRLMAGLADVIPDKDARREHILRNMLFGIAITELTALMSRRSLYCSSDATRKKNEAMPENCYSAVIFQTPEGNIAFPPTEHDYGPGDKLAKCRVCGASKGDLDGVERFGRENHAYAFIHSEIQEIFGVSMQFDVIIGNPPYQLKTGGHGSQAAPIYQLFVERAKELSPKYLSMIIPARWYAGGMGLDEFRKGMLNDQSISVLVDIPNATDAFPGVQIKGGVCYFLRGIEKREECKVLTIKGGVAIAESMRKLNEHDVFIRFNEGIRILEKVSSRNAGNEFVEKDVSPINPFGLPSNFSKIHSDRFSATPLYGGIKCYEQGGIGWISSSDVPNRKDWVDYYKVIVSKAYGAGEGFPHQMIGKPIVTSPGSCCTMTYLVCGIFDDAISANNFSEYMRTKFFRFMVSLRKNSQNTSRSSFSWVPKMDMSRTWTDADLYAHFGLDKDEIAFIESMIKEMP